MTASFYQYHVFFCTNQRPDGEPCCNAHQAQAMRDYAKRKVKQLGAAIAGNTRINSAGCMNRCAHGPVLVIYPQAVWYTYQTMQDVDEIIEQHLMHGQIVERLRLADTTPSTP